MTNCALRFAATAAMPWPLATMSTPLSATFRRAAPVAEDEEGERLAAFVHAGGRARRQLGRARAAAAASRGAPRSSSAPEPWPPTARRSSRRTSSGDLRGRKVGPPSTSRRPRPAARPTAPPSPGRRRARRIGERRVSATSTARANFGARRGAWRSGVARIACSTSAQRRPALAPPSGPAAACARRGRRFAIMASRRRTAARSSQEISRPLPRAAPTSTQRRRPQATRPKPR